MEVSQIRKSCDISKGKRKLYFIQFKQVWRSFLNKVGESGTFILMVLLISLGFFGVIANFYQTDIQPTDLSWLTTTFIPTYGLSGVILVCVHFYSSYKEDISILAYRKSFWLTIIVKIISFFWFGYEFGHFSGQALKLSFIAWQGLLDLLFLFIIGFVTAYFGQTIREIVEKKRLIVLEVHHNGE